MFTTLNSTSDIDPSKILVKRTYTHPIFTAESVAAQKRLPEINGNQNTFHVGAYWGWGFHEDGARSAAEVAKLVRSRFLNAKNSQNNSKRAA